MKSHLSAKKRFEIQTLLCVRLVVVCLFVFFLISPHADLFSRAALKVCYVVRLEHRVLLAAQRGQPWMRLQGLVLPAVGR